MLRSYDENKMLTLKREYIAMPYKLAVETDLKVEKVSETAKFDIDSVNERLGAGDKDALKELEAQKISYSLIENANGYTVKYSYEGNNYTIVYFAPETPEKDNGGGTGNLGVTEDSDTTDGINDSYVPITPEKPEDVEEPEVPVIPEEPENVEEPDFVFDYSSAGVDEDVKAEDLYNEDKVENRELKYLDIISNVDSDVDAGGWDDLFAELEKMKPQLKEYMKQQLEKYGFIYDEETADKLLNEFITQAVKELISQLRNEDKDNQILIAKQIDAIKDVVPSEPLETVEDLVNYIKDQLDLTKKETDPKKETDDLYNISPLHVNENETETETPYTDRWYLDLFEMSDKTEDSEKTEDPDKTKLNYVTIGTGNNPDYSIYLDEGGYLLDTADYFLTEEEKELKRLLEMVKGSSGSLVDNKDEAVEYIDKYAEYLRKVLGHRYGLMPTEEFNQVFNNIVSSFKSGDALEPNDLGVIIIRDALQEFDKQVREDMQKAYFEYLENSY